VLRKSPRGVVRRASPSLERYRDVGRRFRPSNTARIACVLPRRLPAGNRCWTLFSLEDNLSGRLLVVTSACAGVDDCSIDVDRGFVGFDRGIREIVGHIYDFLTPPINRFSTVEIRSRRRHCNTNAVDVAHLEVVRSSSKRTVVDKDAMDDRADGSSPYLATTVAIILLRCPSWCSAGGCCAFEDEFDHLVY